VDFSLNDLNALCRYRTGVQSGLDLNFEFTGLFLGESKDAPDSAALEQFYNELGDRVDPSEKSIRDFKKYCSH
jgi:hypothetical protein